MISKREQNQCADLRTNKTINKCYTFGYISKYITSYNILKETCLIFSCRVYGVFITFIFRLRQR